MNQLTAIKSYKANGYTLTVVKGELAGFIFEVNGGKEFEVEKAKVAEAIQRHILSLQKLLEVLKEERNNE